MQGCIRHGGGNSVKTGCAVLIAGPTASGKSALALALAERHDGVVINADSMQIYRDLEILTARPDAATLARVPHRLYGILDAADPCSAGRWQRLADAEIAAAWRTGRLPILVGGTGLYFRALLEGLADVPPIPDALQHRIATRLAVEGPAALYAELRARDPLMAERLRPTDSQRVARALAVVLATGRSLAEFQEAGKTGLPKAGRKMRPLKWVLDSPRDALYRRIDARFLGMMERGALDEVRRLLARGLDPGLPAMKAIGVPPLRALIAGRISREEAIRRAQQDSRRYAKRQMTWLRTQAADWPRLAADDMKKAMATIDAALAAPATGGQD
ncbi:MAG: tRNA (adenosine(37)-N6)-dimethylallyltransferase MiaA [Alphaproteobacteria bacterium]|nr:MAG: tRNA (adenosine(37)-N6)-dimethylallyltransferase MiaA [Alphaproteobacteria bacterium]